jgi:hypothetical protein
MHAALNQKIEQKSHSLTKKKASMHFLALAGSEGEATVAARRQSMPNLKLSANDVVCGCVGGCGHIFIYIWHMFIYICIYGGFKGVSCSS